MKQILSAVCYMNERKIVHRDIRPANLILAKKGDLNTIRIIDFGLKNKFALGESKPKKIINFVHTSILYLFILQPYYLAPDIIKKGDYTE